MLLTWNWKKLFAVQALFALAWAQAPEESYDVIVIGGGPSGLSAASALSRVLRKVALFDSGDYRNNPTRHMHDVIGSDRMYLLLVLGGNLLTSRARCRSG
jgi:threonine dehydrogenase-like Zn-dependent dehydrogenase